MAISKRKITIKFKKFWKDGRQDDTIYEVVWYMNCEDSDGGNPIPPMQFRYIECYSEESPHSCIPGGEGAPILVQILGPGISDTEKNFPKDFTPTELKEKFNLDADKASELSTQDENIYNNATRKFEPNPNYKGYASSCVEAIVGECEIPETPTPVNTTINSNPVIFMPVQSESQTIKIQVENKSVYKLPLTATKHGLWQFNLVITSEPTDPPLLEDNDGSKDYGIVKGIYYDYFSKSWQITEKKTYSNMLETLPKGIKIRNWSDTSTQLQTEGIDVVLNAASDQAAFLAHSLMKTKSLKARVQRRPRELRAAKKDAAKMIDKSANNNKEAANIEIIENYEREVNQLKLDEFDKRLSKSTNKFFGDSDSQPIDAVKLDSGTQLQSFNVPLINSKQPKFLPGIALTIGRIVSVPIAAWLATAISEAYQTVKIAALAGVMQAGIIWVVETIFTGGIDLFKELVVEKFIDDAVIHDDKTTGSWDTRRIHYELPRCNELQFTFREGVKAELTVTILLHETEQQEYLNISEE